MSTEQKQEAGAGTAGEHTPNYFEPWIVDRYIHSQIQQPLISKRRRIICPPDADGMISAYRIVQCVNAYAGVAEPAKFLADLTALRAQRDRLLEKCKALDAFLYPDGQDAKWTTNAAINSCGWPST